jgi:hypothetical protein
MGVSKDVSGGRKECRIHPGIRRGRVLIKLFRTGGIDDG